MVELVGNQVTTPIRRRLKREIKRESEKVVGSPSGKPKRTCDSRRRATDAGKRDIKKIHGKAQTRQKDRGVEGVCSLCHNKYNERVSEWDVSKFNLVSEFQSVWRCTYVQCLRKSTPSLLPSVCGYAVDHHQLFHSNCQSDTDTAFLVFVPLLVFYLQEEVN
ncbi:hypothetical protein SLA2020_079570 [Shorea laevis]